MAKLLRMPEISANTLDAVLAEWLVDENTLFAANESVASVETDKAVVDVPAEEAGVILRRLVDVGARVGVGAPIAVVGGVGEQVGDMHALLTGLGVASGPPGSGLPAGTDGSAPETAPVHNPTGHTPGERDARAPGGPPVPTVAAATDPVPRAGVPARTFASPLARRLAKEAGLPIGRIDGTGPGGRVVRRDVEAAVAAHAPDEPGAGEPVPGWPVAAEPTRAEPVPGEPTRAEPAAPEGSADHTEVPHTRMRRAIGNRVSESTRTVPHFYLRATVGVDKLLKLRRRLNAQSATHVSLNDLILKAAAHAHTLVPEMNVTWTPDAVRQYENVDIGVAVATPDGLFTPVVTDVANRSVTSVAGTVAGLVARARAGRLTHRELTGGTLSVTNLGMFGTEEFAAIINPPQAAVLAVGAVRREPVVRKGRLVVGTVLHVTLSVDHRPVDGVVAARWLAAFSEMVEKPLRIVA